MRIQRDLAGLRQFVEGDAHVFEMVGGQWSDKNDAEAFQVEMESIASLRSLLVQTIEAISFILLLIDYRLPDVVAS